MKKNFDALKAVRTVQGADHGNGVGSQGNVNPSNQDQDKNTVANFNDAPGSTPTGYNKAAAGMEYDGGVSHDYTSHN